MIRRLGERDGNEADPPVSQFIERLGATFIARMEREFKNRRSPPETPCQPLPFEELFQPLRDEPCQPFPPAAGRLAEEMKGIICALVALAQSGAERHSVAELQLLQVILDTEEVLVTKLFLHHRKESRPALRDEFVSMGIGDLSQFLDNA